MNPRLHMLSGKRAPRSDGGCEVGGVMLCAPERTEKSKRWQPPLSLPPPETSFFPPPFYLSWGTHATFHETRKGYSPHSSYAAERLKGASVNSASAALVFS